MYIYIYIYVYVYVYIYICIYIYIYIYIFIYLFIYIFIYHVVKTNILPHGNAESLYFRRSKISTRTELAKERIAALISAKVNSS